MFIEALKIVVMPPLCLFLAAGVGFSLWNKRPRTARWLIGGSLLSLVLLSLPVVAALLAITLQGTPPQGKLDVGDAQAIVVLGADGNSFAPEYGLERTVGPMTLERLRYAAKLARHSELPVLVSGGVLRDDEPALATAMADTLEQEFSVAVRWRETRSADTYENARFAAEILLAEDIQRVLVVTHAWHEARALAEFRRAGLEPRAAGTGWRTLSDLRWRSWVPSARGLRESSWAAHEWIGRAWYALR